MKHIFFAVCAMLICIPFASADIAEYTYSTSGEGVFSNSGTSTFEIAVRYTNNAGHTIYADVYVSGSASLAGSPGEHKQYYRTIPLMGNPHYFWGTSTSGWVGYNSASKTQITIPDGHYTHVSDRITIYPNNYVTATTTLVISDSLLDTYSVSGTFECVDNVTLYIKPTPTTYTLINYTDTSPYDFPITDGYDYALIFSNGAYYDFACTGDEVFDYDACIYVYGYSCGIDTIKLRDNNSQLIDTVYQSSGYDIYEMIIEDGEEYTISFYDMGILLCYNQTFTCTGDHVLIDFDRCNWVYPPDLSPPYIIYLWTGYDYNVVVFRDEHGNFIENSQIAIYDKTDSLYIHRWTDALEGYTLLGARFDTDHDVQLMLRTFDGIFTLETTYPANGSAPVGEEDITITNWTIPIMYNLNVLPVDQYGVALFDVFCGLSEYTPLNPGAFWGMDLSDQGYVPVTNCSGFAMCDIIAEKEGYADYKVEALNWTSKSALVKDYRHNVVMEEE